MLHSRLGRSIPQEGCYDSRTLDRLAGSHDRDMSDMEELTRIHNQIQLTNQLPVEDTHFLLPRMEDGTLKGAVMVSQGELVEQ